MREMQSKKLPWKGSIITSFGNEGSKPSRESEGENIMVRIDRSRLRILSEM